MPTSEPFQPIGPVMGRRTFLAGVIAAALAIRLQRGRDDDEPAPGDGSTDAVSPETAADLPPVPTSLPAELFALGVPRATRCPTPSSSGPACVNDPLADGAGLPDQPLPVRWESPPTIASTHSSPRATGGRAGARALGARRRLGLEAGTWYWYRFSGGEGTTPWADAHGPGGRRRGRSAALRLRVVPDYQAGYWTATTAGGEDLDLVLFLCDYISRAAGAGAVRTTRARCPSTSRLTGVVRRVQGRPGAPGRSRARALGLHRDDHEVQKQLAGDVPSSTSVARRSAAFRDQRAAAYQCLLRAHAAAHRAARQRRREACTGRCGGATSPFFVLDGRQYAATRRATPATTWG